MFGQAESSITPVEYGNSVTGTGPMGPRSRFFNPYPVELYAC